MHCLSWTIILSRAYIYNAKCASRVGEKQATTLTSVHSYFAPLELNSAIERLASAVLSIVSSVEQLIVYSYHHWCQGRLITIRPPRVVLKLLPCSPCKARPTLVSGRTAGWPDGVMNRTQGLFHSPFGLSSEAEQQQRPCGLRNRQRDRLATC